MSSGKSCSNKVSSRSGESENYLEPIRVDLDAELESDVKLQRKLKIRWMMNPKGREKL